MRKDAKKYNDNKNKLRKQELEESTANYYDRQFPHINYTIGENLNIDDAITKIIKKVYLNKVKYPFARDCAEILCMSDRNLYHSLKRYNIPLRNRKLL